MNTGLNKNDDFMKKVLTIAISVCIVLFNGGFTLKDKNKEVNTVPYWLSGKGAKNTPLSVVIDENKFLVFSFHQMFSTLNIVMRNIEGVAVYDETLDINESSTLYISLETAPPGEYSLFLSNDECEIIGSFTLE